MALTPKPSLDEVRLQHTAAIKAVQEAAVDHDEAERDNEAGTWARSQTYAVFLNALLDYEIIARAYNEALAKAVMRG